MYASICDSPGVYNVMLPLNSTLVPLLSPVRSRVKQRLHDRCGDYMCAMCMNSISVPPIHMLIGEESVMGSPLEI